MNGNDDRAGEGPRLASVPGGEPATGPEQDAGADSVAPKTQAQETQADAGAEAAASGTPENADDAPVEILPDAAPAPAEGEDLPDLQQTVERLGEELENLKRSESRHREAMLRARAEMENLRKRTERDLENYRKYALERFVRELLPVLDSMELGLQSAEGPEALAGLRQGMELTVKMFGDLLQKFGVDAIDPVGGRFDPERHEAVSMQERQEPEVEGGGSVVVAVMQKGYALGDRLIRPARVVVAR